ncbi:MAG: class I SAM-dependent methyltransferase [Bacteroidales bacterium]|nr:class I SAM-dependent methyltransferase [Bacteroidales bacterium]
MQTAERSSGHDPSEHVIYNRCLFAYEAAATIVGGSIIELGSGEGYGIRVLSPKSSHYLAIDKFDTELPDDSKVEFRKMLLPSLKGIADNTFDYAVTFQVIEHIKDDKTFIAEIHRVLKPGGKLLATTPNRKMSLTRNPWHIREYTADELKAMMQKVFSRVEMKGVYGKEKVMEYHEQNKASVKRITRFDLLNLQYLLPRQILQIPYDLMNRLNRRRLMDDNNSLVKEVTTADFYLDMAQDSCFDLFAIATK